MYVDQSYRRVDATWAALSGRLQEEIGSRERWAEQEDLYTFEYMEYISVPQATASGAEARVAFEARLDHEWGPRSSRDLGLRERGRRVEARPPGGREQDAGLKASAVSRQLPARRWLRESADGRVREGASALRTSPRAVGSRS
jgi:hypothetical protein